jgi:hypothetical protein
VAKIIEKTVEKTEDAPIKIKAPVDPDVQIAKLRFWARLIISLMAFGLFGFLVVKMINKPEELTSSGKDLINLAFGAFLPIIGMLGKHWFESTPEPIHPNGGNPPNKNESETNAVPATIKPDDI